MKTSKCRACQNKIKPFIKFGKMPIANAFYLKANYQNQYYYNMEVAFCSKCFCFQLINIPQSKLMFHSKYAYFASTSKHMENHWKALSAKIKKKCNNNNNKIILEIGSNDGIFLKNFAKLKRWKAIGVEPSKNVAKISKKKNLKNIIIDFFSYQLSKKILLKFKQKIDIIVSTNTMHHIKDTNSVFRGVHNLLNNDGIFITEDPSLYEVIKKKSYDQIYAEHMYIWSAISLDCMSKKHGLFLYDLENYNVHGGCTRYYFCHNERFKRTKRCELFIKSELQLGLNKNQTYINFKYNIKKHSSDFFNLISNLSKKGYRICGYTAPAKSVTLINYSRIDINLVEAIFDNTDSKIGKYFPGKSQIPIFSTSNFRNKNFDYVILLAWNHKKEVLKKEYSYTKKNNIKWIIPMSKIEIIQ